MRPGNKHDLGSRVPVLSMEVATACHGATALTPASPTAFRLGALICYLTSSSLSPDHGTA